MQLVTITYRKHCMRHCAITVMSYYQILFIYPQNVESEVKKNIKLPTAFPVQVKKENYEFASVRDFRLVVLTFDRCRIQQ